MASVATQLDYWRVARNEWPALLDSAKVAGYGAVESIVPWALHAPAPQRQDWGTVDERLDLPAFLQLCRARGLGAILRLGPGDDALPASGYPRWVLDDPATQALDANGNPVALAWGGDTAFFAPSYAARAFVAAVADWFAAALARIAPFLQPGGPVIELGIGGGMGLYARLGPFEADFHRDALVLFKEWAGSPFADPPRRFSSNELHYALAWNRFREWLLGHALDQFARIVREHGATAVTLRADMQGHFPGGAVAPGGAGAGVPGAERATGGVRVDLLGGAANYENARKWARYLHIASPAAAVNLLGASDDYTNRALLMHGVALTGLALPQQDGVAALNTLGQALAGARKQARVLVLAVRDYERLTAASTPPQFRPDPWADACEDDERWINQERLGFSRPIVRDNLRWFCAVEAALLALGYASDLGDDELPLDTIRRYRVVICPAFDFMPRATQMKLLDYVRRGGYLIYGPMRPSWDEQLEPCSLLADALSPFAVEPDHPTFTGSILGDLEEIGLQPTAVRDNLAIEVVTHLLADGRRLLFAANSSGEAQEVTIEGALVPFDSASPAPDGAGLIRLPPYTVGVYRLT